MICPEDEKEKEALRKAKELIERLKSRTKNKGREL